jgi:hypothetical protein
VGLTHFVDIIAEEDSAGQTYDEDFDNGHWNDRTRAACPELRKFLLGLHVSEFKELPSTKLYNSLLSKCPGIGPSLLAIVREGLVMGRHGRSVSCKAGAEILAAAGQTQDLLKLASELGQMVVRNWDEYEAYKVIAGYLSAQRNQVLVTKGLELVIRGMVEVTDCLNYELGRALPGLEDAYEWLESLINDGKFTVDAAEDRIADHRRGEVISEFWTIACGDPMEYREWDSVASITGVDVADNDYKEQIAQRRPAFGEAVSFWTGLLRKWGTQQQRLIRDRIRNSGGRLFQVEDLAVNLAEYCSDSESRVHLAGGIFAINTFLLHVR